jgi:hypothetical protein
MGLTNDGVVTVSLGVLGCGVVGDFSMRKVPGGPQVIEKGAPMTMPEAPAWFNATDLASEQDLDGDPLLKAKLARLSPIARHQLEAQLAERMKNLRGKRANRRIAVTSALPLVNPPNVSGRGLEAIPNPAWQAREAKRRQFIDSFLKKHGIQ